MKDEKVIRNLIEASEAGRNELMSLLVGLDETAIQDRFPTVPNVIARMEKAMQEGADFVNNKPSRVPAAVVGLGRRR